jgi:crossover junction endodeoxyribonuclease RuvC
MKESVEIIEYSPKKIKKAITGNGNATKEQVAAMLQQTIKKGILDSKYLDSTDALAAAVCHSYQKTTLGDGKKYKDWSAYIKANDDKVSK